MENVLMCDYCDFVSKNKMEVLWHEKYCDYNPDNKTCLSCLLADINHDGCITCFY